MTDPRDGPSESARRVLYMLDLAKAHIEIGDRDLAAKNLTGCLFALAYLIDKTPADVLIELMEHLPGDEEWHDVVVPDLLGRSDV